MLNRADIRSVRLFVGSKGGEIECVTPDGEIRWTLGIGPGVHFAEKYLEFMYADDAIRLNGTVSAVHRGGRVKSQSFGEVAFQSGANPDFQPTVYSEAEVRLRKLVDQVNDAEKRMQKRERALQGVQVVEKPEPTPEPKPQSEPEPEPVETTPEPTREVKKPEPSTVSETPE